MKLVLKILLLIFTFSFENSISLETYNGQCPHRSQMKTRASWVCGSYPLENYSCLYGTNGSVESCTYKADYAAPGQRYVVKENPHPENCSIYKYQPYKLWSNRSSDCEFIKSECSELGQIMCGIGTIITDLTCRCDHRRGYAFLTTPRSVSFCEPTVEDCSCFLKNCDENMILASDYTCKPSQYFNEHITCLTLPDQDYNHVNASQTDLKVQTKEGRNMFNLDHLLVIITITAIIVIIAFQGMIYFIYEFCYTPLDTVEVFTSKIRRNFTMLKTSINQQTEEQLLERGFITEEQSRIDSMHKDVELLLVVVKNSKTILEKKRKKRLKCNSDDDGLIDMILKMDLKYLPPIPKPSEADEHKQNIHLKKQRNGILCNLNAISLVYEFVENFVFDLIDLKYIIKDNLEEGINERFLEKVQSKLAEGSYWLLQTLLKKNDRKITLALLNIQVVPMPRVSRIFYKINNDMKDTQECIRLEITFTERYIDSLAKDTIQSKINLCNTSLLHDLALCCMKENSGVYKPLRCISISILNKFVRSGGLKKIVEYLVCNDDIQTRLPPGRHHLEALLKRDSDMESSNEIRDFTTESNDAGCNVISVNRKFIMDEMDAQVALEALKKEHFDIRQILGDRTEKLTVIVEILENETEKYLKTLLKVLQERHFDDVFQRLNTSKETFSVNIDEQDLIGRFCEQVLLVVNILKENNFYKLIKDELIEREITFRINGEDVHDTTDLDEIILDIVTTVIKRGRNAMLNFVDVLYKFDKTQIANDLLYFVPTQNRYDETDTEKDQNLHIVPLRNDVLLHERYNLTVPVK